MARSCQPFRELNAPHADTGLAGAGLPGRGLTGPGFTGRAGAAEVGFAEAPGNVLLTTRATGLPKDSVANASQIVAVDRSFLAERCGRLSAKRLGLVLAGIDIVLGR